MPDLDSLLQQGESMQNAIDNPTDYYLRLRQLGVPADVAASIINNPSYGEGEMRAPQGTPAMPYRGQRVDPTSPSYEQLHRLYRQTTPAPRGAQDISYPGGGQMPGMPWDNQSVGAGIMGGGLTPDMIKRIQMYQAIMGGGRGGAGMQLNPNTNNLINQLQGGGQQGPMGLSPQIMAMLNYWQQQQGQGAPGTYPQAGGGVTLAQLAQLLGSPQQPGQPT